MKRLTVLLMLLLIYAISQVPAQSVTFPPQPGERDFIYDGADLMTPAQRDAMREQLDTLLTERAVPIIVVTINSLGQYEARGMAIETYARMLYDKWGIGHKTVAVRGSGMGRSEDRDWNRGVLLLVSIEDRKARIELGAGYGHDYDDICSDIMQTHIVALFKRGDFAEGLISGVNALEQMIREEDISPPPRPWWHYALVIGVIALGIFTFISLIRNGSSGWAWLFWGVVFSILGALIYHMLTSRSRGGGFGGGSFGGGFSGGGGATGSW